MFSPIKKKRFTTHGVGVILSLSLLFVAAVLGICTTNIFFILWYLARLASWDDFAAALNAIHESEKWEALLSRNTTTMLHGHLV